VDGVGLFESFVGFLPMLAQLLVLLAGGVEALVFLPCLPSVFVFVGLLWDCV